MFVCLFFALYCCFFVEFSRPQYLHDAWVRFPSDCDASGANWMLLPAKKAVKTVAQLHVKLPEIPAERG